MVELSGVTRLVLTRLALGAICLVRRIASHRTAAVQLETRPLKNPATRAGYFKWWSLAESNR
jgi:hypothetical protein